MSKIFFISDLHIGHKNILGFAQGRRYGDNINQHDNWLVVQWNSVVKKEDTVYVLGDVCFDTKKLFILNDMNGNKILLPGNHDKFQLGVYQKYFSKIISFCKYKGYWLSHCPIHPNELRGRYNIHGHTHNHDIPDRRYINVCVESLYGVPIEFSKLAEKYK